MSWRSWPAVNLNVEASNAKPAEAKPAETKAPAKAAAKTAKSGK
jgi:hypothetical protein